MEKTYHGSCACQKVTYEVKLDFTKGTQRCNCTYCTKTRNWVIRTTPDKFTLLTGEEFLTDYTGMLHKMFCHACGTNLYYYGDVPQMGGKFLSVRVNTLDDASNDEVFAQPISYADGKHDKWWETPSDLRGL